MRCAEDKFKIGLAPNIVSASFSFKCIAGQATSQPGFSFKAGQLPSWQKLQVLWDLACFSANPLLHANFAVSFCSHGTARLEPYLVCKNCDELYFLKVASDLSGFSKMVLQQQIFCFAAQKTFSTVSVPDCDVFPCDQHFWPFFGGGERLFTQDKIPYLIHTAEKRHVHTGHEVVP